MTNNPDGLSDARASDGTAFGEVQCHCSDDDGVPDVGVSLGLGGGKAVWIGELLTRDGATCGMVFHDGGKRIVAPFANGTDWQEVADILRHHVGPALATPPASTSTAIAEPTDAEQRAYRLGFLRATHPKGWHKDEDWTVYEAGHNSEFRGQMIDDLNSDYPQESDR